MGSSRLRKTHAAVIAAGLAIAAPASGQQREPDRLRMAEPPPAVPETQFRRAEPGYDPAGPIRESEVAKFGNWIIRFIPANKTYTLTGQTTGKSHGHFWLQCHRDEGMTVAFPVFDLDPKDGVMSRDPLTIWSDRSAPVEVKVVVMNNTIAMGVESPGQKDDVVRAFVSSMNEAASFIAYTFHGETFEFDTRHLTAARTKFAQVCALR